VNERGQSTVEVVAVLPLLVAVVLAVVHVLAAGAASESAEAAAEAGAVAILQDGDPQAAAKRALGPSATTRATIAVRGREVTVTVRPIALARPLADVLAAHATADAGPGPAAASSTAIVRGGDGLGSRSSDGKGQEKRP
jgi:hypothetical protein